MGEGRNVEKITVAANSFVVSVESMPALYICSDGGRAERVLLRVFAEAGAKISRFSCAGLSSQPNVIAGDMVSQESFAWLLPMGGELER
jgi:hypothetical protein